MTFMVNILNTTWIGLLIRIINIIQSIGEVYYCSVLYNIVSVHLSKKYALALIIQIMLGSE